MNIILEKVHLVTFSSETCAAEKQSKMYNYK